METTINNETPKRRLEDRTPDAKIDWSAPGAPAVAVNAANAGRTPLRAVASMSVGINAISVFPTPAAKYLAPGHYMLSVPDAQRHVATQTAPLQLAQILDLAARCGIKGSEAALTEFAAIAREAQPLSPNEMRPAPVAARADDPAPAATAAPVPPVVQAVPEGVREALQKIARWHDEFPLTGKEWEDGTLMSYGAAHGSNGERDYMRKVALDALSLLAAPAVTVSPAPRVENIDTPKYRALLDCATRYPDDPSVHVNLASYVAAHLARQAQPTDRDASLEEAATKADAFAESVHPRNASTARNIAAAIRALKGKSGSADPAADDWISVDERLPDDELCVLVDSPEWDRAFVAARFSGDQIGEAHWQDECGDELHESPKFWMYLPKSGAGKSGSEGAADA
jgi:hypothetical protein